MVLFIIISIAISIILIMLLCLFIKVRFVNTRKLKNMFDSLSLTVTGYRGSGKDTIFSYLTYKKEHNSNIKLQDNTNIITLNQLLIPGLTRERLMNRYHLNVDYSKFEMFNNNTYISDAGIYFPNYEDRELKKQFPGFGITVAIWRHLFDGGLYFNLQKGGRLWIILREQIEEVLNCNGCKWFKLLPYVLVDLTFYEKCIDYENGKEPLRPGLFKKKNGNVIVEDSNRGEIIGFKVLLPKRYINHDSRYFKTLVFKEVEDNGKTLPKQKKKDSKI